MIAVRAGPILIQNISRLLSYYSNEASVGSGVNRSFVTYSPQEDFLKLIVCGNGEALGFRFGVPFYGKWVRFDF